MINIEKIKELEELQESEVNLESVLIDLEDQNTVFTFLWVPTSYTYSANNRYSTSYAMFGQIPHTRFISSEVGTLNIDNILFMTPCHNRSLATVRRELEALRKRKEGKFEPSRLSWVTGNNVIQPLFLQNLSMTTLDHVDGVPVSMNVSLSFIGADQISF